MKWNRSTKARAWAAMFVGHEQQKREERLINKWNKLLLRAGLITLVLVAIWRM